MDEYEIEDIDELDDSWIKEIEEEEKEYNSFYKEENDTIKIFYIYINKENKIYYIKKELTELENKVLDKTKLIFLLRNNKLYNNKNHKLISILQYNIDLSPEEMSKYLKNNEDYNFLTIKSSLSELKWDDTINLFKDLNSLHIIYYEKCDEKKNKNKNTKKVYIRKLNKRKTRTKRT
tara:strand:+ start:105 stop:635 length:531 start_codon:yes stop_codon:yes gene_type:complete